MNIKDKLLLNKSLILFLFFLLAWGVRASLRAPRLFPTTHRTPCKPSEQVRHRGGDRIRREGRTWDGSRRQAPTHRWSTTLKRIKVLFFSILKMLVSVLRLKNLWVLTMKLSYLVNLGFGQRIFQKMLWKRLCTCHFIFLMSFKILPWYVF